MYSRKAAGPRDEPGCCRHGSEMPLSGCCWRVNGGGDRFEASTASSDDDVIGLCGSKNADVTGDDKGVRVKTARFDDVTAVDVWRELQTRTTVH